MDLSQFGLFNGLVGKMNWLTQRQAVTAENMANQDTEGYQAMDLTPFSFKNMMKKMAPATTQPGHIHLAGGEQMAKSEVVRKAYEIKPDGNAVSAEKEITKAASTAADLELVNNIYRQTIGLVKLASTESAS